MTIGRKTNIDRETLRLYAITDRTWLCGRKIEDDVRAALKGGVTLVQLREKNVDFETLVQTAKDLKSVCREYGVPLIINDNIDAAIASDADGVHLGQGDTPVRAAREKLGADKIIGATAKTVSQAKKAESDGADYLGSGAVFGSSTKTDAVKMDMATLKSITDSVTIPVVAIGGITGENILTLKGTGIAGAAVVSGIFAAEKIEEAAKDLYLKTGEIV